jgi:parallel beta-helix repeat protein
MIGDRHGRHAVDGEAPGFRLDFAAARSILPARQRQRLPAAPPGKIGRPSVNWPRSRASIGALALGVATLCVPGAALAARRVVRPGESIQEAVDAASPKDTIVVMPGDYTETHGGEAAVRVTKSLKLIAKSKPGAPVRLLPGPGNQNGIVVEPENPGVDADVKKVKIRGFTVEGFPNNGIFLQYVDGYRIERNVSANNLENGIWPTLSANGLVKKNVAYGSQDSALWVEASDNVRVIKNELYSSPTGLEVTISSNVKMVKNDVHDNTVGVGFYHPSGAGLPPVPPYTQYGDWELRKNQIYSNNAPNSAPPGSLSAELPQGIGVLVLGVDRVTMKKNAVEDNDSVGVAMLDWCDAVDCVMNPPEVTDTSADDNRFIRNTILDNGSNPPPDFPFPFGADTFFLGGTDNCAKRNTIGLIAFGALPPEC